MNRHLSPTRSADLSRRQPVKPKRDWVPLALPLAIMAALYGAVLIESVWSDANYRAIYETNP